MYSKNRELYSKLTTTNKVAVFLLVFFSGFANLATEIIGPRLFSSLFGATTIIWAIIISVTLLGISFGYYLGGRITLKKAERLLPVLLVINALWLLSVSWLIWEIPARITRLGFSVVGFTALAAFFAPSTIFSMTSPTAITLLTVDQPPQQVSKTVGNVYAIGTIGSVLGALAAAFYFIPWVGLTTSLRIFAMVSALFAAYFWKKYYRLFAISMVVGCFLAPQPDFQWNSPLLLLTQREGYYQTIRVYSDEKTFIRFHLGPTYESEIDLRTGEPGFSYARTMVQLASDCNNKRVLVIGGAGHSIARALEVRGAMVTEVEIDPVVVEVSDTYFGSINGEVIIQDGRTYVNFASTDTFDYVLIDAFNGPASIPAQLTTVEFFKEINRILKLNGLMIYNFIGTPTGPHSDSFLALSASISSAFFDARVSSLVGDMNQNIIFLASPTAIPELPFPKAPSTGFLLTDDLNPIELFLEKARTSLYFRR